MVAAFLTDEGRRALEEAVTYIEDESSAEIVFAVRPRSGLYLHADVIVGSAVGFLSLAFLLYSPWAFAFHWFLIDPLVAGVVAAWLASRSNFLRRILTPGEVRARWVRRAAQSLFVEKGVHRTRGRTGILIYVSLLEREVEVVADSGVTEVVPLEDWEEALTHLAQCVRRRGTAIDLARAARELGPALAPVLPRAEDDINELADAVCD